MKTFKEYLEEGQIEHQHIKRMMDNIHPTKRAAARKAYQAQKTKGQPHAAALSAMRMYAEDVEQFDEDWKNAAKLAGTLALSAAMVHGMYKGYERNQAENPGQTYSACAPGSVHKNCVGKTIGDNLAKHIAAKKAEKEKQQLDGTLSYLSPDTFRDESIRDEVKYYRGTVRTKKSRLTKSGLDNFEIIPGMTVVAEIKTGERTVMQYLLKPITKGIRESLHER